MDAELDLLENANGLTHNDMSNGDAPEANEYGDLDSEDEIELDNGSDGELTDAAANQLPAHLKEISPLASWTVSTHKPGCGVAALRHPSNSQFWQSDGPQPHFLNIHFVKMVSISYIRVYLDFEQDESYTPTKLHFLAGTGHHDLQNVCTMSFKEPKGWLDVDLSNAGGPNPFEDGDLDEDDLDVNPNRKNFHQPGYGPTLRCRIVQLRILENHQNGKDTHLRGLQIFAIDESAIRTRRKRQNGMAGSRKTQRSPKRSLNPFGFEEQDSPSAAQRQDVEKDVRQDSARPPIEASAGSINPSKPPGICAASVEEDTAMASSSDRKGGQGKRRSILMAGLREPEWMGEPTLR